MNPQSYRPEPGTVPDAPGVYRFRDPEGRVIYVGKAINLRSRLGQYFQDPDALHPRTFGMVNAAASVDWTVVANEVEALQLEYAWIKEFDPRFNVKYRDDKSYPFLAVSVGEEFPRAQVLRGSKRKGVRYFGPYSHAWAIRETLDQLLRVFPIRSCSAGVFRRAKQIDRPCLLGYIGKCSAPCVGRVTPEEHRQLVDDLCSFLAGDAQRYIRGIERDMQTASAEQDYERAARLRDDVRALQRALERNTVVLPDDTDADVIAVAEDDLEAAFQVFHVRDGRVRGRRGLVSEKVDAVSGANLVSQFLTYLYSEVVSDDLPREVLVRARPTDTEALQTWLTEQRGRRVEVKVPQRGDKKALLDTVQHNAAHSLSLHKVRRSGDLTTRAVALEELQESLGLAEAPLRIECYDVSHLSGTDRVASMVVFEDGLPRKSEYRRFSLRGQGNDDIEAMSEVVGRRFRRYLDEDHSQPDNENDDELRPGIDPDTGKPKKFSYRPQLVVVDGGQHQVAAARSAISDLGIENVAVIGLAKRLEEVWVADEDDPLILPRSSQALFLLQRIRDEAHRFAISYQRQRRGKRATASELDGVPGLGEVRRRALLTRFGSVRRLRAASVEEIAEVSGIGQKTATAIVTALANQPTAATASIDTATGEISG
jgi:excinuclease ABC subunit C